MEDRRAIYISADSKIFQQKRAEITGKKNTDGISMHA